MVKSFFPLVNISRRPLHDFMFEIFSLNPERIALVDGQTGRSCSYEDLVSNIRRLASGLHRLGLRKGDKVAVFCPNSIEYVFTVFAVVANGAAACLINPVYTRYELESALRLTRPAWIVAAAGRLQTVQEAVKNVAPQVKGIIVSGGWQLESASSAAAAAEGGSGLLTSLDVLLSDDGSAYPADVQINSETDVALILFSSGTTGLPKGVMLSHYNIVAMVTINSVATQGDVLHKPGEQAVAMAYLPLYHATCLCGVLMRGLAANQKLIVFERFHPDLVLASIEKYKVTVCQLVPSIVVLLSKSDLLSKYNISSIRRFLCGGAPLSIETIEQFARVTGGVELRQGYGLTEITLSCLSSAGSYPNKPGSVGVILPNMEIQVVDCKSKQVVGPYERGEICIRGPLKMLGYINNEEATRAMIDENGWLHSGDIGYYDDDIYFFVVERIKELIKYKGFQVAPAELESVLLTHPDVSDAAVIGVPDNEAGEVPKAFVVLKNPAQISTDQIKHFVAEKVSNFKHLRGGVEFVTKIPKSKTGKILRRALMQQRNQPAQNKL